MRAHGWKQSLLRKHVFENEASAASFGDKKKNFSNLSGYWRKGATSCRNPWSAQEVSHIQHCVDTLQKNLETTWELARGWKVLGASGLDHCYASLTSMCIPLNMTGPFRSSDLSSSFVTTSTIHVLKINRNHNSSWNSRWSTMINRRRRRRLKDLCPTLKRAL